MLEFPQANFLAPLGVRCSGMCRGTVALPEGRARWTDLLGQMSDDEG